MWLKRVMTPPSEAPPVGEAFDPSSRRGLIASVLVVALVAAAVRFWRLDHAPIWMDEAFSILVTQLPARAILFEGVDVHPPLFYLVQKVWTFVAPALSLARVPAAVFGVAAVAAFTLLAADQAPRRAVLPAGLLLALGTAHVYFSQDARMYTLLGFATTLATWGVLGLSGGGRAPRRVYSLLYVVGAAIAVYTHFLALPYLLAINIAWAANSVRLNTLRSSWGPWLILNLLLLAIVTPWLAQLLINAGHGFNGLPSASLGEIPWMIRNALGFPGLPSGLRQAADLSLFASFALGVWVAWRRAGHVALVIIAGLALYFAIIIGLDRVTPILANRVFLPCAPLGALAFGYALTAIDQRWLRLAVGCAALALMAGSTAAQLRDPAKFENIPAALAFADQHGVGQAPILTCTFFTAGSLWEADPRRTAVILQPDNGVLRFDPGFYRALRMSMGKFMHAATPDIDRAAGGGYLWPGGLGSALYGQRAAMAIMQPCDPPFEGQVTQTLANLGFAPGPQASFLENKNGRIIMQPGATRVMLFQRRLDQTPIGP